MGNWPALAWASSWGENHFDNWLLVGDCPATPPESKLLVGIPMPELDVADSNVDKGDDGLCETTALSPWDSWLRISKIRNICFPLKDMKRDEVKYKILYIQMFFF